MLLEPCRSCRRDTECVCCVLFFTFSPCLIFSTNDDVSERYCSKNCRVFARTRRWSWHGVVLRVSYVVPTRYIPLTYEIHTRASPVGPYVFFYVQSCVATQNRSIGNTMVKVWYEPPPHGPRSALNRPAYGVGGGSTPQFIMRLSKMPQGQVIVGAVVLFSVVAYIPLRTFLRCCVVAPLSRLSFCPKHSISLLFFYFACHCSFYAVKTNLPFTCSPEYKAAERAYMRYHNMNPIWGISSK